MTHYMKVMNKTKVLVLALVMVLGFIGIITSIPAKADSVHIQPININRNVVVSRERYYGFDIKNNSTIKVLSKVMDCMQLYQYDNTDNLKLMGDIEHAYRVPAGKYVLATGSTDKDLDIYIEYKDESNERVEKEYNNILSTATNIDNNEWYTGSINIISGEAVDIDYYKCDIKEQSSIYAELSNSGDKYGIEVLDAQGNIVSSGQKLNMQDISSSNKIRISPGIYYIKVTPLGVKDGTEYKMRLASSREL